MWFLLYLLTYSSKSIITHGSFDSRRTDNTILFYNKKISVMKCQQKTNYELPINRKRIKVPQDRF